VVVNVNKPKQFFCLLLICIFAIALLGCGGEAKQNGDAKQDAQKTAAKTSEYPFPASTDTVGSGNVIVNTPSGTSEDGNVPVLFVEPDAALVQIGADLENFSGDKEVFLYVNEIFVDKIQGGELVQSTVSLEEDNLKPGKYTLSAVQYEDNDPAKSVVEYHEAKYKIES
jgi:hypothetical protein